MKYLPTLVAVVFIAFGFGSGAFAVDTGSGMDAAMESHMNDLSADSDIASDAGDIMSWIGKDVKNPQGEELGEMSGYVRDESGEVAIVTIFDGDRIIPVPHSAFSFGDGEDHLVLDATKEQLASAPEVELDESMSDREYAENVYRHFGQRPFWTDEGLNTWEYGTQDNFDISPDVETRGYYGTEDMDIHEYYGMDEDLTESFDSDTDPRLGADIYTDMEGDETVDHL